MNAVDGDGIGDAMPDDQPGVSRVLQSKVERKAFYNKIAKVYDLLAERSEQPMRDAGLALLAVAPGERVLEVGFGTGHCLVKLAQAAGPNGRVFGIDLSEAMLQLSRELVERKGLSDRVELICGDAEELPYESDSMDAIFMSFTLELFDTPQIPRVLAECNRVLHLGGRIVVVGLSKVGRQGVVIRALEWTHQHFPNLLDCRPIFVRGALEAAGFLVGKSAVKQMWVPVEIVQAVKPPSAAGLG